MSTVRLPPAGRMPSRDPSDPSVVVVGESLIDVVVSELGQHSHPGGSPLNVAFGLGRLGIPTTLHTRVGRDMQGRAIADHLADAGVLLAPSSIVDAPTATATARIDAAGRADYTFDIVWQLAPVTVAPGTAILHTGSIAAVLEPGADEVRRLLSTQHEHTLISLDPNVRPSIAPDRERVRRRIDELAALSHVVKLSDEDCAWLYPGEALETVVDRFLARGSALVAVTRGGDGCLLATAGLRRFLPALPVAVVDTIGAGDAFMSGLLYAVLTRGLVGAVRAGTLSADDLEAVGSMALRSAGITVSRAGAMPPAADELLA